MINSQIAFWKILSNKNRFDIGLNISIVWGGFCLGTGVTYSRLYSRGQCPVWRHAFSMSARGTHRNDGVTSSRVNLSPVTQMGSTNSSWVTQSRVTPKWIYPKLGHPLVFHPKGSPQVYENQDFQEKHFANQYPIKCYDYHCSKDLLAKALLCVVTALFAWWLWKWPKWLEFVNQPGVKYPLSYSPNILYLAKR